MKSKPNLAERRASDFSGSSLARRKIATGMFMPPAPVAANQATTSPTANQGGVQVTPFQDATGWTNRYDPTQQVAMPEYYSDNADWRDQLVKTRAHLDFVAHDMASAARELEQNPNIDKEKLFGKSYTVGSETSPENYYGRMQGWKDQRDRIAAGGNPSNDQDQTAPIVNLDYLAEQGITWDDTKRGFVDLTQRFPSRDQAIEHAKTQSSIYKNRFGSMADFAVKGDEDSFKTLQRGAKTQMGRAAGTGSQNTNLVGTDAAVNVALEYPRASTSELQDLAFDNKSNMKLPRNPDGTIDFRQAGKTTARFDKARPGENFRDFASADRIPAEGVTHSQRREINRTRELINTKLQANDPRQLAQAGEEVHRLRQMISDPTLDDETKKYLQDITNKWDQGYANLETSLGQESVQKSMGRLKGDAAIGGGVDLSGLSEAERVEAEKANKLNTPYRPVTTLDNGDVNPNFAADITDPQRKFNAAMAADSAIQSGYSGPMGLDASGNIQFTGQTNESGKPDDRASTAQNIFEKTRNDLSARYEAENQKGVYHPIEFTGAANYDQTMEYGPLLPGQERVAPSVKPMNAILQDMETTSGSKPGQEGAYNTDSTLQQQYDQETKMLLRRADALGIDPANLEAAFKDNSVKHDLMSKYRGNEGEIAFNELKNTYDRQKRLEQDVRTSSPTGASMVHNVSGAKQSWTDPNAWLQKDLEGRLTDKVFQSGQNATSKESGKMYDALRGYQKAQRSGDKAFMQQTGQQFVKATGQQNPDEFSANNLMAGYIGDRPNTTLGNQNPATFLADQNVRDTRLREMTGNASLPIGLRNVAAQNMSNPLPPITSNPLMLQNVPVGGGVASNSAPTTTLGARPATGAAGVVGAPGSVGLAGKPSVAQPANPIPVTQITPPSSPGTPMIPGKPIATTSMTNSSMGKGVGGVVNPFNKKSSLGTKTAGPYIPDRGDFLKDRSAIKTITPQGDTSLSANLGRAREWGANKIWDPMVGDPAKGIVKGMRDMSMYADQGDMGRFINATGGTAANTLLTAWNASIGGAATKGIGMGLKGLGGRLIKSVKPKPGVPTPAVPVPPVPATGAPATVRLGSRPAERANAALSNKLNIREGLPQPILQAGTKVTPPSTLGTRSAVQGPIPVAPVAPGPIQAAGAAQDVVKKLPLRQRIWNRSKPALGVAANMGLYGGAFAAEQYAFDRNDPQRLFFPDYKGPITVIDENNHVNKNQETGYFGEIMNPYAVINMTREQPR